MIILDTNVLSDVVLMSLTPGMVREPVMRRSQGLAQGVRHLPRFRHVTRVQIGLQISQSRTEPYRWF